MLQEWAVEHQPSWQIFDTDGRRKYLSGKERALFLLHVATLAPAEQALCRTLAYTGCRVSEALALRREHIDPERSAITFRTLKRRRLAFRTVPIPASLCAELCALGKSDGRLWSMHRSTAWRCVRRVTESARIRGPMASPRGLRHGFGIHAATRNVPPNLIQRWMGHASLTTTIIYLDAVGSEETAFASRMWD